MLILDPFNFGPWVSTAEAKWCDPYWRASFLQLWSAIV